jgi:hypothetical protein
MLLTARLLPETRQAGALQQIKEGFHKHKDEDRVRE